MADERRHPQLPDVPHAAVVSSGWESRLLRSWWGRPAVRVAALVRHRENPELAGFDMRQQRGDVSKYICTWPASRSVTAGAAPR